MKLILKKPLKEWQITQYFGHNFSDFYTSLGMKGHNGMDLKAPEGTPIYAAHDGVVTFTGEDGAAGLGVVIRTKEQFDYGEGQAFFKTIYWHVQTGSFKVHPSQEVKTGDLIALSDTTGRATGPHLHFGLKPVIQGEQEWAWFNLEQNNGYFGAIDPLPYIDGGKFIFTKKLVKGDKGDEVRELQKALNLFGAFLVVDGSFGQKTFNVLKYYQTENGLVSDGIVGPKTRAVLNQ